MTPPHVAIDDIDTGVIAATIDALTDTFDWLRARGVLDHRDDGLASVRLSDRATLALDIGDGSFAVFDASGLTQRNDTPSKLVRRHAIHRALLEANLDARVVLDTAPRGLATWAIARRALPIRLAVLASAVRVREVPLVKGAEDARLALGDPAARPPGLLLADHGALTWGGDLRAAARRLLGLEEAARLALLAERLGGMRDFVPGSLARAWGSAPARAA